MHTREVNLHILTGSAPACTAPPALTRCCSWSPPWPPRWNANSSVNAPSKASPPPTPKAAAAAALQPWTRHTRRRPRPPSPRWWTKRPIVSDHVGVPSRLPTEEIDALPPGPVSYTHLRAHETPEHLVC